MSICYCTLHLYLPGKQNKLRYSGRTAIGSINSCSTSTSCNTKMLIWIWPNQVKSNHKQLVPFLLHLKGCCADDAALFLFCCLPYTHWWVCLYGCHIGFDDHFSPDWRFKWWETKQFITKHFILFGLVTSSEESSSAWAQCGFLNYLHHCKYTNWQTYLDFDF